ncbi:hypothetical protein [Parerythrobacter aestuarii]|uniref:hypothetical protein n=1 Tax=Parerythrobacter aestuarii TaxID=3020909 RepID=UPI0024DEDF10|nr:hypothetical protein [Parerythrobacter aestuarii]
MSANWHSVRARIGAITALFAMPAIMAMPASTATIGAIPLCAGDGETRYMLQPPDSPLPRSSKRDQGDGKSMACAHVPVVRKAGDDPEDEAG